MADVNRGNRPLSPHLTIYRPQFTSMLSIFHRLTGIGMTVTAVTAVIWFLGAAGSTDTFACIDGWITSWVGNLVLFVSLLGFWFHFCNGIRHLIWDLGYGFDVSRIERSAMITLGAAGILSLLTIIIA